MARRRRRDKTIVFAIDPTTTRRRNRVAECTTRVSAHCVHTRVRIIYIKCSRAHNKYEHLTTTGQRGIVHLPPQHSPSHSADSKSTRPLAHTERRRIGPKSSSSCTLKSRLLGVIDCKPQVGTARTSHYGAS